MTKVESVASAAYAKLEDSLAAARSEVESARKEHAAKLVATRYQ